MTYRCRNQAYVQNLLTDIRFTIVGLEHDGYTILLKNWSTKRKARVVRTSPTMSVKVDDGGQNPCWQRDDQSRNQLTIHHTSTGF